ncbi:ABC transporter permease [Pseudonocardia lacus]|uniref:ABC transporter permease n=1 Tax=Pseudonocardia lacus TaxID=2835865 RepID=UPI001BDC70D9|nr:ABC transporter permease subunit [Pseudonocardia lacus]
MARIARNLGGLLGFALLWEVAVRTGLVPERFVPPPTVVLAELGELVAQRGFLADVLATVLAWAIALGLAAAIAVPAGLVLGSAPAVRVATRAVVEFLRPIPSVALIPLVVLLVGSGPEAKIALAAYAAVWPILFNTVYALGELDTVMVDTARVCGAGRARTLTSVALPHAAPFVFTGIRMSAAVALIVVVSTEFLAGAARGIGRVILEASSGAARMDVVLAATLVAGLVGFAINEGLERLGARLFAWSPVAAGAL